MPQLLNRPGGLHVDDRGPLWYVNDFDPFDAGVRRFYMVANHRQGFIRAWHAHRHETKYVIAVCGSALIAIVPILDFTWNHIDDVDPMKQMEMQDVDPERFVLSDMKPSVLRIPAGYANGFRTLTPDCRLMFFSTATLEESKQDDYRLPFDFWDPWHIEER